jgi:hypothetical protein
MDLSKPSLEDISRIGRISKSRIKEIISVQYLRATKHTYDQSPKKIFKA